MEFYSERTLDHFLSPRNAGELPAPDGVGRHCVASHNATFVFHLAVRDDHLADVRFQVQGCAASIAAASALTVMARGRRLAEAGRIQPAEVVAELDGMPEDKLFSVEAALETLRLALADARRGTNDEP